MGDARAILVTGGAGYIGSFVVRACVRSGMPPVVLDDASTGHLEAVRRAGSDVAAVRGHVGDQALVRALVTEHRITACVHLAGSSRVGESTGNPLKYFQNNVAEGVGLLEALLGAGVRQFVFSSSAAVYGPPAQVPIVEDAALRPISPYGDTKMVLERVLERLHEAHGLRYAALRYFNAAGADPESGLGEDHDPETHLIPLAVDAAMGQRPPLTVFGDDYPTPDGTCIRDYVDVRDVATAHVAALAALEGGPSLGAINLGTGRGHSVMEVLRAVTAGVGRPVPHSVGPRRAGDPPVLVASGERARTVLGWAPRYALADSVAAAAAWRRAWPRGYPAHTGAAES